MDSTVHSVIFSMRLVVAHLNASTFRIALHSCIGVCQGAGVAKRNIVRIVDTRAVSQPVACRGESEEVSDRLS